MFERVDSVAFFVADVAAAAQWYADILRVDVVYEHPRLAIVQTAHVRMSFQPADAKSPSGVGGTTVYWRVSDVTAAMNQLIESGATRQRGPYVSEAGECSAILVDPFGNTLGLSTGASA